MNNYRLLALDLDGTVLDESRPTAGLETLRLLVGTFRDQIKLLYATGRSCPSTLALVKKGILPAPDAIAAFVGTELWYPPWQDPDPQFADVIEHHWNRANIVTILSQFKTLKMQPKEMQTPRKISYFTDSLMLVQAVEQIVEQHQISADVRYSCGRFLDIIPIEAGKLAAVDFLKAKWQIEDNNVLVGGNSGNDLDMLADPNLPAVVVSNSEQELQDLSTDNKVFYASLPFAAGVLEGAEAHHFWQSPQAASPKN